MITQTWSAAERGAGAVRDDGRARIREGAASPPGNVGTLGGSYKVRVSVQDDRFIHVSERPGDQFLERQETSIAAELVSFPMRTIRRRWIGSACRSATASWEKLLAHFSLIVNAGVPGRVA